MYSHSSALNHAAVYCLESFISLQIRLSCTSHEPHFQSFLASSRLLTQTFVPQNGRTAAFSRGNRINFISLLRCFVFFTFVVSDDFDGSLQREPKRQTWNRSAGFKASSGHAIFFSPHLAAEIQQCDELMPG